MNNNFSSSSATNEGRTLKSNFRYILPTIVTLMNAIGGLLAIYAVFNGYYMEGVLWIFFGFFADTFDGPIARHLNATSKFGAELDSLCDVITFGIAPFVVLFAMNRISIFISFIYILCALLRLARFGSVQSPSRRHLGLASPMAAIWVVSSIGLSPFFSPQIADIILSIIVFTASILMISTRHYHKILAAASFKLRIIEWVLWLSTGVILIFWWLFAYDDVFIFIIWLISMGYALFLGAPFLKWDDRGAKAFFQKG